MKRGKFLVLEGIDGSGKATQLKLLKNFLKKQGCGAAFVDFPQYGSSFFGELAGRFLKGEFGGINEVSPYLACLPFAGDRFQAKKKIEKWLSLGKVVVANRYIGSNMAHQAAKLSRSEQLRFFRFLEKMEYEIFKIPREDLVVFLSVPAEIGQTLVGRKEVRNYVHGRKHDIHEADLSHLHKTAVVYSRLARNYSYWHEVNCCDQEGELLSPREIHQKIIGLLKNEIFF